MLQLAHLSHRLVLPTDWFAIERALRADYGGYSIHDLAQELDSGQAQLWEISGEGVRLLLVTEVVNLPVGRELHLRYVSGRGWFKHFGRVLSLIETLAQNFSCRFIAGKLRGRHAERWYKAYGGRSAGTWCYKDLYDEQFKKDHDHSMDGPLSGDEARDRRGGITCH